MIPGTGALVLGRVYLSHYNSVYALSFTLSIYMYDTLIVIVLRHNTAQGILFIQLKADPLYSFALSDYREADYPEADPD